MCWQDEPNFALRLGTPASGQDTAILSARDYPLCPARTIKTRKPYYKYFIDQACSVKMAGYWPRSFLRIYGPRFRLGP